MPPNKRHILILGGTTEAIRLASAIHDRFDQAVTVTSSLAGRTREPSEVPGQIRIGGFGGTEGLAKWLRDAEVDLVVDATHPFAARISANARQACDAANLPRLILSRPLWQPMQGDRWHVVANLESAAAAVPAFGSRVFLSIGSQALAAFAGQANIHFIVRMIDAPTGPLSLNRYSLILGKGPFDEAAEIDLLTRERIDTVVSRNSGGPGTVAKISAARYLGLPVIMVSPPPLESGCCVFTQGQAMQWIEEGIAS